MKSFSWCSLDCEPSSKAAGANEADLTSDDNSTVENRTDCNTYPFCVQALITTIDGSNVRIYDLLLVTGNVLFLLVLLIRMVPTIRKLLHSLPLFKILYSMVFVIPIMSLVHGMINMFLGYKATPAKVTQILVRGSILMTEISVVIFGLFFRSYADQLVKLCFTVFAILVLSAVFAVAEGVLEFYKFERKLACHELDLFTHGGMLFLFTTSLIFAIIYLLIYLMYLFGLSKRWEFPSKKSFYRYALVLSVMNILQAIGSMLWYTGRHKFNRGNAGICITSATTFVYLTTFAPVVYWIFLKNYFRMNNPSAVTQGGPQSINAPSHEAHLPPRRRFIGVRFSKPTLIGKRSSYFEEQTKLEGDFESSVSSYGSVTNSEEIFSRLDN